MSLAVAWIAVLVIVITTTGLLLVRDWRWSIILLAVQFLGMFVLTLQHWPLGMAAVKVVAGWMAAAILGMTRSGLAIEEAGDPFSRSGGGLFRLFAAAMVLLLMAVATPAVDTIMADAGFPVTNGALLLIGMGLLNLGMSAHILRVTIGLITVLSGFEILYAAVEGSVLVAALLAAINLGLALAGAYLLIASNAREPGST
ncbi:MAG TPA: hypothetical protein VK900_00935 [Anaerolineales bacterium]|nr:hypothetical protein [Anaerolineales bacterium]